VWLVHMPAPVSPPRVRISTPQHPTDVDPVAPCAPRAPEPARGPIKCLRHVAVEFRQCYVGGRPLIEGPLRTHVPLMFESPHTRDVR
jgi:hypothetical protein